MAAGIETHSPEKNLSKKTAVWLALFVTILWSTSWVLIKIGLKEVPALSFAGLRYGIAFLVLLPFALRPNGRNEIRGLNSRQWLNLILLGVVYYAITQGAQFLALAYIPAAMASLVLNLTSIFVAGLGILFLAEIPSRTQWAGIFINLAGVLLYFFPPKLDSSAVLGLVIIFISMAANSAGSILGRQVNRTGKMSPLTVTTISMGIGAALLLLTGGITQGFPKMGFYSWGIIVWMAAVNTALAFTLWNRTLRVLQAMESSLINSTMLVQIAILSWVFLKEPLTLVQIGGIILALIGTALVQKRNVGKKDGSNEGNY